MDSRLLRQQTLEGEDDMDTPAGFDYQHDDPEIQARLNESKRGGNNFIDCTVLSEMRSEDCNSDNLQACDENFEKMYGIKHEVVHNEIRKMDPSAAVIQAYDLRASVRTLSRWTSVRGKKKRGHLAEKIEEKCTQAIGPWEEWLKGGKAGPVPDVDEGLVQDAKALFDEGSLLD